MRSEFYSVPETAYLFPETSKKAGGLNSREEPVRQWCAFELIRAYGVNVSDLSFEEPVKVGSKTYRIDILVKRHGKPWIVVECKEPKFSKHERGLEQALSYAGADAVRAEFAVYTNGTEWLVRRNVLGEWCAATDIPFVDGNSSLRSIDELLRTIDQVSPILCKLDEPIAGLEAQVFFEALQVFFYGTNQLTADLHKGLRIGTDNLLRVISTGPENRHHSRGKLSIAASCFESYRKATSIGFPVTEIGDEHLLMYAQEVSLVLDPLLEAGSNSGNLNDDLLRLDIALLRYLSKQSDPKNFFPVVAATVHEPLRRFLTKSLALNLNVELLDSLESDINSDVRYYCASAWKQAMENGRQKRQVEGEIS